MPDALIVAVATAAGVMLREVFQFLSDRASKSASVGLTDAEREQTLIGNARGMLEEQRVWFRTPLDVVQQSLDTVEGLLRDEQSRTSTMASIIDGMTVEVRELREKVSRLEARVTSLLAALAVAKDETAAAKEAQ